MRHQILNNTLKRLLLAHKPIKPLGPVLQNRRGTLRSTLQVRDVGLQLGVGEVIQCGVGGGAETVEGREVELHIRGSRVLYSLCCLGWLFFGLGLVGGGLLLGLGLCS